MDKRRNSWRNVYGSVLASRLARKVAVEMLERIYAENVGVSGEAKRKSLLSLEGQFSQSLRQSMTSSMLTDEVDPKQSAAKTSESAFDMESDREEAFEDDFDEESDAEVDSPLSPEAAEAEEAPDAQLDLEIA